MSQPERATTPDVRLITFYLPQFHTIPENDAWWGTGFTDWTNVRKARPNFVGHYQPHVPGELGYYSLLDAGIRYRQAELARAFGIHGFCYYQYWFNGKQLLERPLQEVLTSGEPDFPFCICWANENWTRRWDGQSNDILMEQCYSSAGDIAFIENHLPLLADPRYIRIQGRLMLLVYRVNLLPEPRATADRWREKCVRNGLGDPYLCTVLGPGVARNPAEYGFDAAVEFPPHMVDGVEIDLDGVVTNPDFSGGVYDYVSAARGMIARAWPGFNLFRGVMPSWDNTARLQDNGMAFVNTDPKNYERWLRAVVEQTRKRYASVDERVVFINAWNEWGEGCHLEPDERYGRAWLEATRRSLL